jgi:hypothetical protein
MLHSPITPQDLCYVMRRAAWQRAKGELQAMLEHYTVEYKSDGSRAHTGFDAMDDRINRFITEVEDNL